MLYSADFAIPPNTPKTSPIREVLGITKGTITQVFIYLPWGCAGLVGLRIFRYEHQIYPLSQNRWIIGNDKEYIFTDSYVVDVDPFSLMLEGYNLDDTFEHILEVKVNVLRPTISEKTLGLLDYLSKG